MKTLSLNAKIIFVLAIFFAASVVISWLGVRNMSALNVNMEQLIGDPVKKTLWARTMDADNNDIRNAEKIYVLRDNEGERAKFGKNIDDLEKEIRGILVDYRLIASEAALKDLSGLEKILDEWKPVNTEMRLLVRAGKKAEAIALVLGKSEEITGRFDDIVMNIIDRNNKKIAKFLADGEELYINARNLIFGASAASIFFGFLLAFFILRQVNRGIDQVITNLTEGSNKLALASQQISTSSEQLSQGAATQASSLEETSSSIEEMNSMVKKNADTARQSTDISQTSGSSAAHGKRVVDEMKGAMVEIDAANGNIMRQTTESNQKISAIVKVISEIGEKTKVINEIVFQTKLLSFNASVEAARAGEHGKGFAVVAEEVGKLAEMSGNAAKEITSMLDSSIQKVEGIVHETKSSIEKLISESKAKVEFGTKVAINCGEVLGEIVTNVSKVTQMSQSISAATDEQSHGIHEITKAVAQLDQMTQQNAATAQETSSTAQELSAQAVSMQGVVQSLVQTVKGG